MCEFGRRDRTGDTKLTIFNDFNFILNCDGKSRDYRGLCIEWNYKRGLVFSMKDK